MLGRNSKWQIIEYMKKYLSYLRFLAESKNTEFSGSYNKILYLDF